MKMESRNSSKKRISLLWKRLFSVQKSAAIQKDTPNIENKSMLLNEETQMEKDLQKSSIDTKDKLFVDCGQSCPNTILKKTNTNPGLQSSMNNPRHATFMEVVQVHEYVMVDTLANEEHYTSEASLTDDDENHVTKKNFYLDTEYAGGDFSEDMLSDSEQTVPSDCSKTNRLLGDQVNYDAHIKPTLKNKAKSKKPIKHYRASNKTKVFDQLVDDAFFDFAC